MLYLAIRRSAISRQETDPTELMDVQKGITGRENSGSRCRIMAPQVEACQSGHLLLFLEHCKELEHQFFVPQSGAGFIAHRDGGLIVAQCRFIGARGT